jgi:hypothetical protein
MLPVVVLAFILAPAQPLPGGASSPTTDFGRECWVQPLEVSLAELALMGQVTREYVDGHCARLLHNDFPRAPGGTYAVARTRLGTFGLFGERLAFGFDVVVRPGVPGAPDNIYAVPAIDLPEKWQQAIDSATYPALAVAGTAVITAIILKALHR